MGDRENVMMMMDHKIEGNASNKPSSQSVRNCVAYAGSGNGSGHVGWWTDFDAKKYLKYIRERERERDFNTIPLLKPLSLIEFGLIFFLLSVTVTTKRSQVTLKPSQEGTHFIPFFHHSICLTMKENS
jgi:hypothetical protein